MVVAQLVLSGVGSTSVAADFATSFGGTAGANFSQTASTIDAAGNVYIVGRFTDATLTIGTVTITRKGVTDTVVTKIDASGAVVWVKNFGGSGAYAYGQSIAVDASGNVYLGGYFFGANLTNPALTRIGFQDAFAFKLDSAGTSIWSRNFGGSGADALGQSIAVDASGNVYLGGYLQNANLTTPALTKIGSSDAFAVKLDSAGTSVWAKNFGGNAATAVGQSIAVDATGNVYIGGYLNANLTTPAITKIGSLDAFAFKLDSVGTTVWSKNFGGSGANAQGRSIAVDASGNVYLGGSFSNTNLTTPALTRIGSTDAFAFKLDSAGSSVWSKNFGASGANAEGQSIAVDASGNVYLGGYFQDANLTTPALTRLGSADAFAFKLDTAGTSVWARNFGGNAATAVGQSIAVDASGNVYLGGYFYGANLINPALTRIGDRNTFAIKLDGTGNTTLAKAVSYLAPGGNIFVNATAVDATGNTYLSGNFSDVITVALGGITLTPIGNTDIFVAKLNAAGTVLWAKNFGGNGADAYGQSIAVDASGNVYLSGNFQSANLTSPALTRIGNSDAFAFKLGSAGNSVWAKNFGGIGATVGGPSIAVDASGNVYLGGTFQDANLTTPALARLGGTDAFAFKLDSAGNGVWARNFGGSAATAVGQSLAVDAFGNVYIGGYFNANLSTPALTKIGNWDAFAFKLDSTGTTVWSKNFGGFGAVTQGRSIAVDAFGNVYLGGYFSSASLTTPALTRIGDPDAFAFKLGSTGTSVWAKNFGGSGAFAYGQSIAVDASGNVYLGGFFGSANLTTPALTRIGIRDAFAFKLGSAGTSVWSKNFGGSGARADGRSIAVDTSGYVYLGGNFSVANLTTPALTKIGNTDAFIIKRLAASSVAPIIIYVLDD